jgi:hypothetical protein
MIASHGPRRGSFNDHQYHLGIAQYSSDHLNKIFWIQPMFFFYIIIILFLTICFSFTIDKSYLK